MKKLDARVKRKKEIWQRYKSGLQKNEKVALFDHQVHFTAPWFIDAIVDDRDLLIQYLKEKEIGTRVMYPPINTQRAYDRVGSFAVSHKIGQRGLWLPSFVQITDDEIAFVCSSINEFYN
jgi:perosamine synthetase